MSRKINGLQGLIMCIYINVTKSLATKALIILTFKYPVLSLSKLLDIKIIVFSICFLAYCGGLAEHRKNARMCDAPLYYTILSNLHHYYFPQRAGASHIEISLYHFLNPFKCPIKIFFLDYERWCKTDHGIVSLFAQHSFIL